MFGSCAVMFDRFDIIDTLLRNHVEKEKNPRILEFTVAHSKVWSNMSYKGLYVSSAKSAWGKARGSSNVTLKITEDKLILEKK